MSSVGFFIIFVFVFFNLKATASDMGPTRPRYIFAVMISLHAVLKVEVRFLERPTVAVALTVSYIISRNEPFEYTDSKSVDSDIIAKEIQVTEIAFVHVIFGMFLPKSVTSSRFLIEEMTVAKSTARVTVLIPPAVPTGEPPINIKKRHTIAEESVKYS